jgi:RNA polymerase sigma factor (TIGR02999 family)
MTEVTRILESVKQGDKQAARELLPLVYDELRQLAAVHLNREKPGQTLQPTALVHEAYLKLVGPANAEGFENRRHFFGAAAQAMRRILVDHARHKGRDKRGGGWKRSEGDLETLLQGDMNAEVLSLHDALEALAAHDPAKAKLVELRFFGGLTLEQAAECMEISLSTADRSWRYARAWLYAAMAEESDG